MKKETIIPVIKVFDGSTFNLDLNESIILNSIDVYKAYEGCVGELVPFDIQKISKKEMRIIPHSTHDKFIIKYDHMVYATTFMIRKEDFPRYKNTDGFISISFNENGTVIN